METDDKKIQKRHIIIYVVLLIVELILLQKFTGLSFWLSIAVFIFFAIIRYFTPGAKLQLTSRGLVTALTFFFVMGLGNMVWKHTWPTSHAKIVTLQTRVDHFFSGIMGDDTETMAKGSWEAKKNKAGEVFMVYYNGLLEQGETKKAADTLKGFNKQWNPDLLKDDDKKSDEARSEKSSSINPIIIKNSSKVFELQAGEETPWFGFEDGKIINGKISSPSNDFDIIISDGSTIKGGEPIGTKKSCYYKVKARSHQFLTVTAFM